MKNDPKDMFHNTPHVMPNEMSPKEILIFNDYGAGVSFVKLKNVHKLIKKLKVFAKKARKK